MVSNKLVVRSVARGAICCTTGGVRIADRAKGPVTRGNFPCNLQCNSTPKRCKFVTNVWYVKNISANCDGNMYLPILHLSSVELHCKLQEELHRVTGP